MIKSVGQDQLNLKQISAQVLKAGDSDESAAIVYDDTSVILSAGPKLAIGLDASYGIAIKGKTSFTNFPGDIQFAGLWKFNNNMLSTIPSTITTPVPVMTFQLPTDSLLNVIRGITETLGSIVL